MAIKGSLKEASLPDVIQLLFLGRRTGCLALADRNNFGTIYFDEGHITFAAIVNRRDRLGDIMVASGRGAQLGVLFRDAEAIESLREIDTLVIDKTGTLTVGKPALHRVITVAPWTEDEILALAAALVSGQCHAARPPVRLHPPASVLYRQKRLRCGNRAIAPRNVKVRPNFDGPAHFSRVRHSWRRRP